MFIQKIVKLKFIFILFFVKNNFKTKIVAILKIHTFWNI
jgi:hypothetical protein